MNILAALFAISVTVALLPVVTRLAFRIGAVTTPRVDRWGHRVIPTLGGIAIAAGVTAGSLLVEMSALDRLALVVGIALMAMLGLVDDLTGLSPQWRVLVEAGAAAAFTAAVSGELAPQIRLAAIVIAAACVPVAINATNLVDNADGLASVLSALSGIALAGIVAVSPIVSAGGALGLVIAAASIGFLFLNRPPARMFMGDSGSLTLGFALAASCVLVVRDAVLLPGHPHIAAAIAIPLVWAFQVGDLAMVFVTRLRRGSSPFRGGVDHTSHRLVQAGLGPVGMLLVLSAGAAAVGAVAIALSAWAGDFRLVTFVTIVAAGLVGSFEALVAWRLPYGRSPVEGSPPDHVRTTVSPEPAPTGGRH
jgi:UDP-GlcNAc:undecaprenyl-phosphate GlcNAc-1-phosphate transferase